MAMEISVIIVHTGLLPLKDLGLTALFVQLPVLMSWRKQNCIGLAYRYKYLSANVSVYAEARGVWGHAPPGKSFSKFDAVRWVLRLFWAKHHC